MTNIENKIIAYFNGELNSQEVKELMSQRKSSEEIDKLFLSYQSIETSLNNVTDEKPSENLSQNFYNHLEKISAKENVEVSVTKTFSIKPLLKYAAVIIILLAACLSLYNNFNRNDATEGQLALNELLSDMESKSETEKIKAIYVNNQSSIQNQSKIIEVLIASLKNDKSSNVRLASVETLTEFISDDHVRSTLIRSLGKEEDPQVQIAIIMALTASKSEDAIKPLEQIINKEGGYKFVKDEAHVGIMSLTSI